MPQPIDMQTEFARTVMADRVQNAMDRASLAAQQRALTEADEERLDAETQVQETKETENRQLDADGRRRNPYVGRRRRGKGEDEDREDSPKVSDAARDRPVIADDQDMHGLDVSI